MKEMQYRGGLKKVVKLLNKAEEQIQKGYNKKASEHVNDCLSAMRGLDADSPLFRSKTQLNQCTILSGMLGKHEEALGNWTPPSSSDWRTMPWFLPRLGRKRTWSELRLSCLIWTMMKP